MTNRRIFLKALVPLAAALTLPGTAEAEIDLCQFHADGLAAALKAKHGGNWDVTLNPEAGSIFGRRLG